MIRPTLLLPCLVCLLAACSEPAHATAPLPASGPGAGGGAAGGGGGTPDGTAGQAGATSGPSGAAGAAGKPQAPPHVASAGCPLRTPAAWQGFLEEAAEGEAWVKTCSDLGDCSALVGEFSKHVQIDLLGTLALCAEDVAANPPIAACTDHLRRFAPAWLRQHDEVSYGFAQDNLAYQAAQEGTGRPAGMMKPPSALLAALPQRSAIEQAARSNGWPYLTHDSCLGGVRTFIVISDPDGRFDQWMLFNLSDGATVANGEIMSFIGIQRRDAAGAPLQKVRLNFRDYVVATQGGSWGLQLNENQSGKCYACHGSGVRQLLPTRGSVVASAPVKGEEWFSEDGSGAPADFGFQRLVNLNERLAAYGVPDWDGTLEPADHGPALGGALGCTSCHDGKTRGVLTVHTSEGMILQKIVGQLSMRSTAPGVLVPDVVAMALLEQETTKDPPLTQDQQAQLDQARQEHLADYQAFVQQRLPSLQAWLLEQRCD
jgi:hypothetical protein